MVYSVHLSDAFSTQVTACRSLEGPRQRRHAPMVYTGRAHHGNWPPVQRSAPSNEAFSLALERGLDVAGQRGVVECTCRSQCSTTMVLVKYVVVHQTRK